MTRTWQNFLKTEKNLSFPRSLQQFSLSLLLVRTTLSLSLSHFLFVNLSLPISLSPTLFLRSWFYLYLSLFLHSLSSIYRFIIPSENGQLLNERDYFKHLILQLRYIRVYTHIPTQSNTLAHAHIYIHIHPTKFVFVSVCVWICVSLICLL